MKKTLLFMISAILAVSALVSCGGDKEKAEDTAITTTHEQPEDEIITEESEKSSDEEIYDTEDVAETSEQDELPIEPGTVEDLTYESRYLGIGFKLDESWAIAEDDVKTSVFDGNVGEVDFTDVEGVIRDYGVYPDAVASSSAGSSISIVIEAAEGELTEDILEIIAGNAMNSTVKSYAAYIGQIPVASSLKDVEIAGTVYTGYTTSFEMNNIKILQEAAIIPRDGYIAVVSVSGSADSIPGIWSKFYAVE